jgi:NAD(P)-dependent dehydrogenase (short-subunit alcohol dehydrogenase family)
MIPMTADKPLSIVDTLLDRTLVGYSNIGYALRRASWPPDPPSGALDGAHAVVTGAKSGLGKAAAIGLARLGASVHIVVRGREAGQAAAREIGQAAPGAHVLVDECDVSLLSSVRDYAARVGGPVHVLVHNAGVMPPERRETSEGNELMLATHVLGPHLMTALLRPAMQKAGRASVIWVSSGGMYGQGLHLDDLQYRHGDYQPTTGYARTKRMEVVLARLWDERLSGAGIAVDSMHPGWADTPGISSSLPRFRSLARPLLRSPQQGADTIVWLAARRHGADLRDTGRLWHDRVPRPEHYLRSTAESAADRAALWKACQDLTGLSDADTDADATHGTGGKPGHAG